MKKILVVDDDEEIRNLYQHGLENLGYSVRMASSAGEAKQRLGEELPDLIIMDIMMPDTDGVTLTREIRSDSRTAPIPILVVSALSDAATLNDALLFGAVDYLVKPFEISILKLKLERALALAEKRKSY
ncbi:MAG: response regulator [Elusimicrobia bacterium]|nr:response regulator [Elusimicrobiota bacterium]